jgi:protein PhnA
MSKLIDRANNACELCTTNTSLMAYTVSPKNEELIANQVAICEICSEAILNNDYSNSNHWRALTGSIWSDIEAVQALSYRILNKLKAESWAQETIESVYLDESTIDWALADERAEADKIIHKDGYGNILEAGDNVVLIENLNVKGTSYIAPKGTQVKKIRLVHDNAEQVEGKINGDTIVILTKFLKKA